MVFVTFGMMAELLFNILHFNTYTLYAVIPAALLSMAATGGIPRTLRNRAAWLWLLFFACMALAAPFSSWKGGSIQRVIVYAEFSMPLMFVVAGLTVTWDQVRALFYTIGWAAVVNLIHARLFAATDENGRISLEGSGASIGNSNDLSSHLVLVLPFLLFIATDARRSVIIRLPLLAGVGYGFWIILGTASRGALVAVFAMFVFIIWRATAWQRVIALIVGLMVAIAVPVLLPTTTLLRLASLFGGEHEEAKESGEARNYLLQQSLLYTLQHPLFGVGPDQFSNYEGMMSQARGEHGEWHATHNAFTEISSECGIPAAVFFIWGIGSALGTVNRTWRRARRRGVPEVSRVCFFYTFAMIGYLVSIFFLANAYRYYLPSMIGLAIAIGAAGTRYLDEIEQKGMAVQPAGVH